ncbi:MAG: MATE family efflux transporter [Atopobiaceae bacterium]|jgi:putative MATE family efflux protein
MGMVKHAGKGRLNSRADPDEKYRQLTEAPVKPLILSLAAPSIVSNLVTSIYNLSDTFYIGGLGTSASAAVGVSFVAMTAIQAIGFFFGQGAGNPISRYLGAKDLERARMIASTEFVMAIICGFILAIVGNALIVPICILSGSTETILPFATTFIGITLWGAPFMCGAIMLNMVLRFEGEALYSMAAIMVGAVLNIALEPIFIYVLGMGIAGSALATDICQALSCVLLIIQTRRTNITPISLKYVRRPTLALLREAANGGVPSFVRQVMLGVATTLLNNAARPFGDAAIAGLAITQRICGFGNYIQIGIGQGFQPVIGYNYGARKFGRIREGYFFSMRAAFIAVFSVGVVTCVAAPQLIAFFNSDPEVVSMGTLTLRVESFTMSITGVAMITNFLLQTCGRMWRATILGACRLGLVLGPVVLVLPHLWGLVGVQLAQPATDLITTAIAIPMALSIMKELRQEESATQ